MTELNVEGFGLNDDTRVPEGSCPMRRAAPAVRVQPDEELIFPNRQRIESGYSTSDTGELEFHLYYGDKELIFDEPPLHAFGETLAKQTRFVAATAMEWGGGYEWSRVEQLLSALVDDGILQRADAVARNPLVRGGSVPSPLPHAATSIPRTWLECEQITRELTGRAVELGYLELLVPVYRIAHPALDAEGRQVGEANVFPPALRLDVKTEWRSCSYPGSRFQDKCPMNVTALKSMVKYWKPMMATLLRIRNEYLNRFPDARERWTISHVERLATLVLSLPTYLLMRDRDRVESGRLHPLLSSMFRVSDGLRMTAHFMLVLPTDKRPLDPSAPIQASDVYPFAEKTAAFLSTHGVCAGPRPMIEEFLSVLVDGKAAEGVAEVLLDEEIEEALTSLGLAFDYGLHALQAYAVSFSLWISVSKAYQRVLEVLSAAPEGASGSVCSFRHRVEQRVDFFRVETLLGTDDGRNVYARVYADMYEQSQRGLRPTAAAACLEDKLTGAVDASYARTKEELRDLLVQRFAADGNDASLWISKLAAVLMDYLQREQATVRTAVEIQRNINELLGRRAPARALVASDLVLQHRLHNAERGFPYVIDDLADELGIVISVSSECITLQRRFAPAN